LDNCNIYEQNKLKKIQLESVEYLLVLTTRPFTLQSVYRETDWLTLADIRMYQKLVIMLKVDILSYQTT